MILILKPFLFSCYNLLFLMYFNEGVLWGMRKNKTTANTTLLLNHGGF